MRSVGGTKSAFMDKIWHVASKIPVAPMQCPMYDFVEVTGTAVSPRNFFMPFDSALSFADVPEPWALMHPKSSAETPASAAASRRVRYTPSPRGSGCVGWWASAVVACPIILHLHSALLKSAFPKFSTTQNAAPSPIFMPSGVENGAIFSGDTTFIALNPAKFDRASASAPPVITRSHLPDSTSVCASPIAAVEPEHAVFTIQHSPPNPSAETSAFWSA